MLGAPLVLFLAAALLLLVPSTLAAAAQFAVVTDVHLEWDYNGAVAPIPSFCRNLPAADHDDGRTATAQYGCDSPPALLTLVANNVAASGPYDVLLYLGDHCPHGMSAWQQASGASNNATLTVMQAAIANVTTALLATAQATGSVYIPSLGNEDFLPDDAAPGNSSIIPWLTTLANSAFSAVFQQPGFVNASATFSNGGYYRVDVAASTAPLTVLVLNTVIYLSNDPLTPCDAALPDPLGQFAWLQAELQYAYAEKRTVWIIGHVPTVVQWYSLSAMWKQCYAETFAALVEGACSQIGALLFGHEHMATFSSTADWALAPSGCLPPFLLHPSVSPINFNNPGFRLYSYANALPLDYADYYLNISLASSASAFSPLFTSVLAEYNLPSLASTVVDSFGAQLQLNQTAFTRFWSNAFLRSPLTPNCAGQCLAQQACVLQHVNYTAWQACSGGPQ